MSKCYGGFHNYGFECPRCCNVKTVSKKTDPIIPHGLCPECGSAKGKIFGACRKAKLRIAGEDFFFCLPNFRCEDCDANFWLRNRVRAECLKCGLDFDFAMKLMSARCIIASEKSITSWAEVPVFSNEF